MGKTAYDYRNLAVCNGYGMKAGLDKVYRRITSRKDCPQWLKDDLADLILRAQRNIEPLVEYRELAPRSEREEQSNE